MDSDPSSPKPAAAADSPPAPGGHDDHARLRERLLTALLAAAERRGMRTVVSALEPPVAVLALPDRGAAVVLFDRGGADVSSDELQARLDRLLDGHAAGVLYLVLCGGDARDLPVLKLADRRAPDPDRLGVYHLPEGGRLAFVAGRRLGLLPEAARLLPSIQPLSPEQLASTAQHAQQAHEEAVAFATALQGRPQTATRALGITCIALYALSGYWGGGQWNHINPDVLHAMGGNGHVAVLEQHQWWRLLSHAFLHAGFVHFAVNLVGLWSFGTFLEGLLGWRRYLLLYGLAALAGGVASALLAKDNVVSVGASGALWGLMAAGVGLVTAGQRLLPGVVAARLRPRLYAVLALNVAFTVLPLLVSGLPRIDLYAHAGGGLLGFLLVITGVLTRGLTPVAAPAEGGAGLATAVEDPLPLRVGAYVMLLAMLIALAAALAQGRPWDSALVPGELI